MVNFIEPTKILLVTNNPSIIEDTQRSLIGESDLELMAVDGNWGNIHTSISESKPHIILFDFETLPEPATILENLISEYPACAVMVIQSGSGGASIDRMANPQIQEVIPYPYPPGMPAASIHHAVQHTISSVSYNPQTNITEKDQPGNTFIVFSPKGGAGTTTLATNLAISLYKSLNEDVLLIDGKHLFGHVALYLNLRTGNSITDLITHANMLDEQLIRQVVIRHTSGISVLPSPNSITEAQGIKPEDLYKVILGLQQVFPTIIIDGGNHLDENTVTYMDSSDKILLVINPDLASLRDVRQFMQVSASLAYPFEKILLVLNLTGRKADVKRDEIENILKMKIFGKIPADDNLALSCLNEGVPILLKKPRHPISSAFSEIAADLTSIMQSKILK